VRHHEIVFQSLGVSLAGTFASACRNSAAVSGGGDAAGLRAADRDRGEYFPPRRVFGRGIAVYSFDKPCSGSSSGDRRHFALFDRATQAETAIAKLKEHPDVDERRVGVWGQSQGGWIVQIVASRTYDPAFAITNSLRRCRSIARSWPSSASALTTMKTRSSAGGTANGLIVNASTTHATGTTERQAALALIAVLKRTGRVTLGADKGYDTAAFVAALRARNVTRHIAQNTSRRSGIDARTTRHKGYVLSQRKRKRVGEIRTGKTVGNLRKSHFHGLRLVSESMRWTSIAFNLVRMRNLGVCT